MPESIDISTLLSGTTPEQLYRAWLDGESHSAFTGSPAEVDPVIGGRYSAWEGYITGANLEFEPYRRIIQSWRTTEFTDEDPDSRLEILFEEGQGGTTLHLVHTGVPDGEAENYRRGWIDYYFKPMQEYFSPLEE